MWHRDWFLSSESSCKTLFATKQETGVNLKEILFIFPCNIWWQLKETLSLLFSVRQVKEILIKGHICCLYFVCLLCPTHTLVHEERPLLPGRPQFNSNSVFLSVFYLLLRARWQLLDECDSRYNKVMERQRERSKSGDRKRQQWKGGEKKKRANSRRLKKSKAGRKEEKEKREKFGKGGSHGMFAWPGLGHLGNTDTAAKERKTREERERGKEGRMTGNGRRGRKGGCWKQTVSKSCFCFCENKLNVPALI